MNRIRTIIVICGLLISVGFCLRPPYQREQTARIINPVSSATRKDASHTVNIGHYWIWNPPQGTTGNDYQIGASVLVSSIVTVDYPRLGVYIGVIALITLAGTFVIFTKKH